MSDNESPPSPAPEVPEDRNEDVDQVKEDAVKDDKAKKLNGDAKEEEEDDKDKEKEKKENGVEEEEDEEKKVVKEVTDEEFFSKVSQEELEWYEELGPTMEEVEERVLVCTTCHKQVTNESNNTAQRHSLLGVLTCRTCKTFYNDGEWTKDEEGSFEYCRWCGNGGDLLMCDKCPEAFCKRCVQRNLGRKHLSAMDAEEEWACFVCDPKAIYKFRAEYYAVSKMIKAKKAKGKKKGDPSTPKKTGSFGVSKKLEAEMLKTPSNFVDKSLRDCLRAFTLQSKALEDEQKRWLRTKRNMGVDNAVMLTKNLRKLFAATKHNMEVLDEMILENFHDAFPQEEFSKVRIAKVTTQSNLVPTELKRKLTLTASPSGKSGKSSPAPKKRPISAKKAKKRPAPSSNEIVLNGEAVTQPLNTSSIDPMSMLAVEMSDEEEVPPRKKPKIGPKSAMAKKMGPKSKTSSPSLTPAGKSYKVSTNMFAKKKKNKEKAAKADSDSDIEVIDL